MARIGNTKGAKTSPKSKKGKRRLNLRVGSKTWRRQGVPAEVAVHAKP